MLGACGDQSDARMFHEMVKHVSTDNKGIRPGMEAVISSYLMMTGEDGLPLVERTRLASRDATFLET